MKVLGLVWNPSEDSLAVPSEGLTVHPSDRLTKRRCLSLMNSIFDPLGLLSPITVRAKTLLRKQWGRKLDWDEPIGEADHREWMKLFEDLRSCEEIKITRCIKPMGIREDVRPTLIMFSDASEVAMGTVAYARYLCEDGRYASVLVASKSRVAPIQITSIVRLELSAAVLSVRLAKTILEDTRLSFQRVMYIVDSEIVRSMIQKESYGFKTFVATRIGEIQQSSDAQDWWWISGEKNIADIISRGVSARALQDGSWQNGPDFLECPIVEWPISQTYSNTNLPERIGVVLAADVREEKLCPIDIHRFSRLNVLLRVTALIKTICRKKSFKSVVSNVTSDDLDAAKLFWVKEAQKSMEDADFEKEFARLGPRRQENGIIVVGDRIKDYCSYNQGMVPLLPYHHRFTRLVAEQVHARGHNGVDATMFKVRAMYWVVRLRRLVKSIWDKCIPCRRLEGETQNQQMAPLPEQRLKPSPPWTYVGCDLFGPFTIKGEIQKRVRGKAYGVIFDCLVTRAVYLDLATDYSTEAFLKVFRRFTAIRGYPREMFSDQGSQIVAACENLKEFGVSHGVRWTFSVPESPWQNGVTESLIRGVKKSLFHVVGKQILTFEELQTVLMEVADVVNGRPIGRHPTDPRDGSYLSPNDLLLGRSTKAAPGGPWCDDGGHVRRWKFLQRMVEQFWQKWRQSYWPTLILRQKWHTEQRNLKVGDVVVIKEEGVKRGKWKTGIVFETFPDSRGLTRNVSIRTVTETGVISKIKRAAQQLVLLVPVEEQK